MSPRQKSRKSKGASSNNARWRELLRYFTGPRVATTARLAREYLALDPTSPGVWLILGQALYKMAQYTEACRALRRARRLFAASKLYMVDAELGHLHRKRGAYRAAELCYRRAVARSPSDATYHVFLGALLAQAGRLEEAAAVHRRGTRCKKGCIDEAFLNLGLVLRALGRYSEARRCFRRALEIEPRYWDARDALADVEDLRGTTRKP